MYKREWRLFIEDILESITLIENYTSNMGFDDFAKDRKTVDAVVRNFEVLGEASKYIHEEVKNNYQNIDWKGIIGFRNRITHEYFGISLTIIWHIIMKELPELKEQIRQIQER